MRPHLLAPATMLCLLAAAAPSAADTVLAPDPAAQQLTALDGSIVWVSGAFGSQRVVRRTPGGVVATVPGAPVAKLYRSIDLGHDGEGGLVLTYLRCDKGRPCRAMRDDLAGHRTSYRHLARKRCTITAAPALWRSRIAYGQECRTRSGRHDPERSGLYVRSGSRAARHLRRPADARRFGVDGVESVDLRATRVAAVVADIFEYAYSQTVNGTRLWSFLAAASEGESEESARGLAIGAGAIQWSLTDASHSGDPDEAIIFRLRGDCLRRERLVTPAGEEGYRATDVAVDGTAMTLLVPGTGIVAHTFAPEPTPACT